MQKIADDEGYISMYDILNFRKMIFFKATDVDILEIA
jgi:hypothetical protein